MFSTGLPLFALEHRRYRQAYTHIDSNAPSPPHEFVYKVSDCTLHLTVFGCSCQSLSLAFVCPTIHKTFEHCALVFELLELRLNTHVHTQTRTYTNAQTCNFIWGVLRGRLVQTWSLHSSFLIAPCLHSLLLSPLVVHPPSLSDSQCEGGR